MNIKKWWNLLLIRKKFNLLEIWSRFPHTIIKINYKYKKQEEETTWGSDTTQTKRPNHTYTISISISWNKNSLIQFSWVWTLGWWVSSIQSAVPVPDIWNQTKSMWWKTSVVKWKVRWHFPAPKKTWKWKMVNEKTYFPTFLFKVNL